MVAFGIVILIRVAPLHAFRNPSWAFGCPNLLKTGAAISETLRRYVETNGAYALFGSAN